MTYSMTRHATQQAKSKGWNIRQILDVAEFPSVTYISKKFPHQQRRSRDGVTVVVDTTTNRVITTYVNDLVGA